MYMRTNCPHHHVQGIKLDKQTGTYKPLLTFPLLSSLPLQGRGVGEQEAARS